uniref:BTB domain-containing protein n=1 Tax=Panagrellus redivivus TaxID=6233 RepID=A0A7E5A0U3_PANRE
MNLSATVKDVVSITLNDSDLSQKDPGETLITPKREIPCSNGLKWWIQWYPGGFTKTHKGYLSLYLFVNKSVKSRYSFAVHGSSLKESGSHDFNNQLTGQGNPKFVSHEKLRNFSHQGKLKIICAVEFDIVMKVVQQPIRIFQCCDDAADFELIVELRRLPVHKNFLTLISPVFCAMLAHDTRESRKGETIIPDFSYDTVKAAIDFCYGRELENLPVNKCVGILRFADKYDIKDVTTQLEPYLARNLSTGNFCSVIRYAQDLSRDELLKECFFFFSNNEKYIKFMEEFVKFSPAFIILIIKSAFSFKNDYEVLRHAHKNGITIIVDQLEQSLLKSISYDTFCLAVSYAWDCSRENFKKACACFINHNKTDVLSSQSFFSLPSKTVYEVLKLNCDLCNAED